METSIEKDTGFADRTDNDLSRRQREVLQLAALGCGNKEIAGNLQISPETVKTHMERMRRKLGTSDRTSSVVKALMLGIIQVTQPERPVSV